MSFFKKKSSSRSFGFSADTKDTVISSKKIKNLIGASSDVKIRELKVGKERSIDVTFVYIDGMVNTPTVDESILKSLTASSEINKISDSEELIGGILTGLIPHTEIKETSDITECVDAVLFGFVALIFDDIKKAILFDIKGFDKRTIPQSANENVIKGGRDCFIEIMRSNTALVRTHMQSENLRIIEKAKGKQNHTQIAVVYLEGVADENVVDRVMDKLDSIEADNIITSTLVEDHIIKKKFAIFPRVLYTERPDKFSAHISKGKIGLIINGLPTAYIIPVTFGMFMQAAEDYSYNIIIASIIKVVRYLALLIALLVPAYYISITNFHQEMIPRELAVSIIKSKEGVPFSSIVETLFILFIFELLIEAGMRMPKAISTALSIIGAIVLGEAAISAKFISAAVVVTIALSGIAGFAIPNQDFANAIRTCRIIFALSAAVGGFFGMLFACLFLLFALSKSECIDVPYLYPLIKSENVRGFKDRKFFKFPLPLKGRMKG